MTELLPCPFCGSEAIVNEIPPHKHAIATFMPDHPGSFVIECAGCSIGMIHATRNEVVAAWNRRALRQQEPVAWRCSSPPCKCDNSNFRQCAYATYAAPAPDARKR